MRIAWKRWTSSTCGLCIGADRFALDETITAIPLVEGADAPDLLNS